MQAILQLREGYMNEPEKISALGVRPHTPDTLYSLQL